MFARCFGAHYEDGKLNDLPPLAPLQLPYVHSRVVAIRAHVYPYVQARLTGLTSPIRGLTLAVGDSKLIESVDPFLKKIEGYHVGHTGMYSATVSYP